MNQKIIAIVRLARGEAAFYDEFTNIHLTLSNPEAAITNTMNTVRIKRAVENRVLRLVAGSFTVKEEKEEPKIVEEAPVVETPADDTEETVEEDAEEEEVEAPDVDEINAALDDIDTSDIADEDDGLSDDEQGL